MPSLEKVKLKSEVISLKPEPIRWKDVNLDICAKFVPQRLWFAASIDVLFNDRTIISTGGQLKFKGTQTQQFEHGDSQHQLKLTWGPFIISSIPCILYIDNEQIAQRKVKAENQLMHLISVFFLWISAFFLPFLACMTMQIILGIMK